MEHFARAVEKVEMIRSWSSTASVAGGGEPDLRSGEKMQPAAQARARYAWDVPRDIGKSQIALQRMGLSGRLDIAFIERVYFMQAVRLQWLDRLRN